MFKKKIIVDDDPYAVAVVGDGMDVYMCGEDGGDIKVEYAMVFVVRDWRNLEAEADNWERYAGVEIYVVPVEPVHGSILRSAMSMVGLNENKVELNTFLKAWLIHEYLGGVIVHPLILEENRKEKEFFGDIDVDGKTVFFRDMATAVKFIEECWEDYAMVVSALSGFILDQRVNLIGNTGWDIFKNVVTGECFIEKTLQKVR